MRCKRCNIEISRGEEVQRAAGPLHTWCDSRMRYEAYSRLMVLLKNIEMEEVVSYLGRSVR